MFQALPIMENDWKPVNCVKEKELEEEEKLDLTFKIYYNWDVICGWPKCSMKSWNTYLQNYDIIYNLNIY